MCARNEEPENTPSGAHERDDDCQQAQAEGERPGPWQTSAAGAGRPSRPVRLCAPGMEVPRRGDHDTRGGH